MILPSFYLLHASATNWRRVNSREPLLSNPGRGESKIVPATYIVQRQRQEYEIIAAKSACSTADMKPEQLADTSKLREADKVAFLKMRGEMEARERRLISAAQIWGQTISVPWSNAMEQAAISSADDARALHDGTMARWQGDLGRVQQAACGNFQGIPRRVLEDHGMGRSCFRCV